jgi:hypothetical protein
MKNKFLFIFLVLNLYQVNHIDCACAPPDPPAPCFSQQNFNEAFENATISYDITEQILKNSYDVHGFLITEDDPVYHHFKNHDLDEFAVQQNRFTTIMINAIQSLKSSGNYTKQQIRMCLKNITLPSNLPNITLNCVPSSSIK